MFYKYNINNINELVLIIGEFVKTIEIIKDAELVRLLIFVILDSKKRKVLDYNDEILKKIYKYLKLRSKFKNLFTLKCLKLYICQQ